MLSITVFGNERAIENEVARNRPFLRGHVEKRLLLTYPRRLLRTAIVRKIPKIVARIIANCHSPQAARRSNGIPTVSAGAQALRRGSSRGTCCRYTWYSIENFWLRNSSSAGISPK